MGKAFSEQERISVQKKLRETGLKLFSEKGIKGVSVRELTSAANIAQGGFYTFYKDKTDFIIDLMELRINEKLSVIEKSKEISLDDPVGYLSELYFSEGMKLKKNKVFDNSVSGTLEFYLGLDNETISRIKKHYRDFIEMLVGYWSDNGYIVSSDIGGLTEMIRMAGIFISNSSMIDEEYFCRTYKAFCAAGVNEFLRVSR